MQRARRNLVPGRRVACSALIVAALSGRTCLAAPDRFVADFILSERLKADNRLLEQEVRYLEAAVRSESSAMVLARGLAQLDAGLRARVLLAYREGMRRLVADLGAAVGQLHRDNQRLQTNWESVRQSLAQQCRALEELTGSRHAAAQRAALFSADHRWFWGFSAVAAGTLLAVVVHDRRRAIRSRLRGVRRTIMVLAMVLGLAVLVVVLLGATTFLRNDRPRGAARGEAPQPGGVVKSADGLAGELAAAQDLHRRRESEWRRAMEACCEKIDGRRSHDSGLMPSWMSFREQVRAMAVELALVEAIRPALVADLDRLHEKERDVLAEDAALAGHRRLRRNLRVGLGTTVICLTALGGVFFWRGVRGRGRRAFDTCPLCLGHRALREETVFVPPEAEGPPGKPPRVVRCRNLIRPHPPEECNYRFSAAYRPMAKVCFPTMGVPQAGKTHWLAMLYWTLHRGHYSRPLGFEKVRSESTEDFDTIVEEILRSRIGTAATQRERIPHPVVFNFTDRDRWGRANLLLNLFDYSGEVTVDLRADDHRRRRALDADGFLFFLDPTFPAAPQAQALAGFREDLRVLKGLPAGRTTGTPMALCVSKIDLLPRQPYALPGGGDEIAKFYAQLAQIDPTGESYSLRAIEARSRSILRLRETIWPGWEIERQLRDLFGRRHLFFPLTPVGLEGGSESDLSLRTISPFAILEPLLWLLHMNGYCVLRD